LRAGTPVRDLRWGGEAGYVLSAAVKNEKPPDERRVSMYGRGQILLRAEHGEIAIGYGQGQARDGISRGSEACHVASVVTNVNAFLDRVAQTRRTGKAPIEITRAEGASALPLGCSLYAGMLMLRRDRKVLEISYGPAESRSAPGVQYGLAIGRYTHDSRGLLAALATSHDVGELHGSLRAVDR
jgi:hypothetical protein